MYLLFDGDGYEGRLAGPDRGSHNTKSVRIS
jgi:hypothetical protein